MYVQYKFIIVAGGFIVLTEWRAPELPRGGSAYTVNDVDRPWSDPGDSLPRKYPRYLPGIPVINHDVSICTELLHVTIWESILVITLLSTIILITF